MSGGRRRAFRSLAGNRALARVLERALTAAELSDGTLRYLLWVAALLTPRPAELTVLNEPEASLHPDLLPALAALIARSSERSQVLVVTHSPQVAAKGAHHWRVAKLEAQLRRRGERAGSAGAVVDLAVREGGQHEFLKKTV